MNNFLYMERYSTIHVITDHVEKKNIETFGDPLKIQFPVETKRRDLVKSRFMSFRNFKVLCIFFFL